MQETEIVPSGRLKGLEKFYVGKVSNAALIEEDIKGNLSEEVRGQWVTEQFIKAATTLHVDSFVVSLEHGGVSIPEIPEMERYVAAHLKLRELVIHGIEATLPMRQKVLDRHLALVEEADQWIDAVMFKLDESVGIADPTEEESATASSLRTELEKLNKMHDARYNKWNTEHVNVQKDLQIVEDWRNTARKAAMAQHDADCDALRNVNNTLALLKKYLADLIKKVPSVGPIVRQMGEFGGDPYELSDMRRCYANLLNTYRKTEDLDVATTVIVAIKDTQQGNESLGTFTRRVQEFHGEMVKMGVTKVSIADLCAIIMISGMKEASRKAFMQTETTLALAMGNDAEGDEAVDGLDDEKTLGGSKVKRSLLGKTLRFVAKQEAEEQILAKLSGNSGGKKSEVPNSTREALKRVREAQQAYAVAVRVKDRNACFDFARTGKCSRGAACQYKHEVTAATVGSSDGDKLPQGECKFWYNTGSCPYGASCRFDHTTVKAAGADNGAKSDGTGKGAGTTQRNNKTASRVLFTTDRLVAESDEDDYAADVSVVLARSLPEVACATSQVVSGVQSDVQYLGWDSMCSLHVANSLDVIPNAVPLKKAKEAVGMGGVKPITHKGHSNLFGRSMSYIQDGGTPNLLSVGQECQKDKTGLQGMALFSASGAVRFRVTPTLMEAFVELVNQAEIEGLVQGKAVLHNNVYKEAFGPNGALEPEEVYAVEKVDSAFAVSHNLFASRVRLDSVDSVLDFMVASGLSKEAMLEGIQSQSLRGMPKVITEDHVKQYFKFVGKSTEQLEAEITKAALRVPIDFEVERAMAPGAVMQIDNVDPSFSRMAAPVDVSNSNGKEDGVTPVGHKKVVPSVGGYKDAVIAIDEATGYAHLLGRVNKKDPHKVLAQFLGKWKGRWGSIKFIKADQEFVTQESMALVQAYDVRFRQAVPGDHRRTTSKIEGSIRWILEVAQGNMNRLRQSVKDKIISERQARTLWFHALRQAVFVFNFRPSLCDATKTRYEMGTGDVANLSTVVLMPFGMRVMGKNLLTSADGRGSECLYIGPSSTVRGGILTYSIATERVSIKYSFLPITDVRRPSEAQARKVSKEMFGPLHVAPASAPAEVVKGALPGWEEISGFETPGAVAETDSSAPATAPAESLEGDAVELSAPSMPVAVDASDMASAGQTAVESSSVSDASAEVPAAADIDRSDSIDIGVSAQSRGGVKGKKVPVVSEYNTRRRAERVLQVLGFAIEVENEEESVGEVPGRPPKPKVPPARVADKDARWIAAEGREAAKLMEEETFVALPTDKAGRSIRPDDAIVLRLLKIREYKWKPDPDTGVERWLECVRLVCDGSVDKRPEKYYAETPDRTLLLLMTSIEASQGIRATGSDVTRAYLNAESLDRNIVIRAPNGLKGLPRESLLNKGLYGSRGGALSWQVWIDAKLKELGFRKLQVCRGVYMKNMAQGDLVRAYRHSDDFRMSSTDEELRIHAEKDLRALVRMAEFTTLNRFLGCTFERVNAETGLPDEFGTIVLVRQVEKIREMEEKFAKLHEKYNKKNRARKAALPVDAIKDDDELTEDALLLLSPAEVEVYQSLVGSIQWVVGCTRPDGKLGCFLLSIRLAKPRGWDMYLAVYVMDYLVHTADAPLVLGGPESDPVIFADASFATLPERRSIVGHVAFSGKGSGAIYAQVGSTKSAVTSIWEAELVAGCGGMDTGVYLTSACKELEYEVPSSRSVMVDNKAEIDWVKGSVSNKRSRHIDVKYYRSRHLQESGEVSIEYVPTEENVADILTKPLVYKIFLKFARIILGHGLLLGKGIKGIFEKIAGEV